MILRKGSRVILHPNAGGDVLVRALEGRRGIVDALEEVLDGRTHVAVVLEDDPARDMGKARRLAHRFFLAPEEVEATPSQEEAFARVLVAGIGNIFLGDDGFGVAVARRLLSSPVRSGTNVAEFGIRGMDLVYALGDGYDAAILIDAAQRGQPPGTLELIEAESDFFDGAAVEGHGMHPAQAIALARQLGPLPEKLFVVACEPDAIPPGDEMTEGLSAPVAGAVERAAALVLALVERLNDSNHPSTHEEVTPV